jgi:biotin carboxylase
MHILVVDPRPASRDYIIRRWAATGHQVSAVGAAPSAAVRALVGRHEPAHLADRGSTIHAAGRIDAHHSVDGVVAYGQAATRAANWVAHALSLPAPWDDPDLDLRDKAQVARRWRAAGVPQPQTLEVHRPDDDRLARLSPPVVVKPSSMMGGLGVRRCDSTAQARRWVARLLDTRTWAAAGARAGQLHAEYGAAGSVVVQECLRPDPGAAGGEAPEYTLECVVNDGVVHVVGSFRKYHSPAPFFEERSFVFPAPDLGQRSAALHRLAQRALGALGFRWGVCHLELCFQSGLPYLFEVNPRLIGETTAKVLCAATDTHVADLLAATATGRPVRPSRRSGVWGGSVHVCAGEAFTGRIFRGLRHEPEPAVVEWVDLNRPLGCEIRPPGIRPSQILARVGVVATDIATVEDRMSYWLAPERIDTAPA